MTHQSAIIAAAILASGAAWSHAVEPPPPFALTVTPTANYAFDADLDGGASMSVGRAGVSVVPAFMLGQAARLSLNSSVEYSRYEFDNLADFEGVPGGTGDVPDDLLQVVLRPTLAVFLSENFAVFGGPVFMFGGEPDVDVGESITYGGLLGFNYQIAPDVWVGTGVAYTQQLAEKGLTVPLVNVAWRISDQWRFDASGLSGKLSYAASDQFTIFAAVAYEFREYRLGDSSLVSGGVLSDESVPVTLGVDWKVDDHFTVGVFGGIVAWRQVEFFDSDDSSIANDNAAVTGYGGVKVELAF